MANKCLLIIEGRLTGDPILNYAKNGTAYVNTRLAYSRKDKNAPNGYASDFYSLTAYDTTAEILAQFKKGQLVQIEGRLKKTEYENKQGVRVRDIEIMTYRAVGVNYPAAAKDGKTSDNAAFGEMDLEDEGLAEE